MPPPSYIQFLIAFNDIIKGTLIPACLFFVCFLFSLPSQFSSSSIFWFSILCVIEPICVS